MSKNDMKLIMEGWRRSLKEMNAVEGAGIQGHAAPQKTDEELDEGMKEKIFGALLAFASMGQVAQAGETVNGYDFGAKAPISVDASVQGVSLGDVADELKKRGDNETAAQLVTVLRQVKKSAELGMGVDRKTATDQFSGGDNIADTDGMDTLEGAMGDRADELIDVINDLASGDSPESSGIPGDTNNDGQLSPIELSKMQSDNSLTDKQKADAKAAMQRIRPTNESAI